MIELTLTATAGAEPASRRTDATTAVHVGGDHGAKVNMEVSHTF